MNTFNANIDIILKREENHLIIHDSYLVIEFAVEHDAGGIYVNYANSRLANYVSLALFSSIKLETSGGRTQFIDNCHPYLMMYK